MEYGDTQEQRKNFVDTLMFRFDKPILDVGSVKGIKEEVDLNVFNGTLEDLEALTIQ